MRSSVDWPKKPYKGLNYFRPQDRPLLAGRDDDIDACAGLLAHPQTRVLLVHGATGCGKSSFLRAGLIPVIEEESAGYLFLKTSDADYEALFIRCTEAPVDQIAAHVYRFATAPFQLHTPIGSRQLDLRPALLGADGLEDYLALTRKEEGLTSSLRRIAEIIPQTLVLIVDQAEEVLTLNPADHEFINRAIFFGFLREFQKLEFDARIIVTLRTEYYGRFADATLTSYQASAEYQQFFLGELSRTGLIEAIVRPTGHDKIGNFGVPYDYYGFSYEQGLPELIVDEILGARFSGPPLPVLQLVCLGLYEDATRRGQSIIRKAKYGGVENQIIEHIRDTIRALYQNEEEFQADIDKVREFLVAFYTMQNDGSVVARTHELWWITSELGERGLSIGAAQLIKALASPETMVLRPLRNVKAGGNIVDELTLGHDSVALALERWKALEAEKRLAQVEELRRHEQEVMLKEMERLAEEYHKVRTVITPSLLIGILNLLVMVSIPLFFIRPGSRSFGLLSDVILDLLSLIGITLSYRSTIFEIMLWIVIVIPFGILGLRNLTFAWQKIRFYREERYHLQRQIRRARSLLRK